MVKEKLFFSEAMFLLFVWLMSQRDGDGDMGFAWELAHKEKDIASAQETIVSTTLKVFLRFLFQ